ncbi:MAG: hypothetical protein V4850_16190 [Myxococcota bacterium]
MSLRERLHSKVPPTSFEDWAEWFYDLAPLRVDPAGMQAALQAVAPVQRVVEFYSPGPVLEHLAEAGRLHESVSFNLAHREYRGGRTYCFYHPDRDGLDVTTGGYLRESDDPRVHLQAVPRAVRHLLLPPPEHVLVNVDIKSCFLAAAAALTGDPVLRADLDQDVHQLWGDHLVPELDREGRKGIGKLFNNALIGGMTEFGVARAFEERGVRVTVDRARAATAEWWSRYSRFADLRLHVWAMHERHRRARSAMWIEAPDGRMFHFDTRALDGTDRHEADPIGGARRSTFSSLFRAVEGCVLDRALALVAAEGYKLGVRLVVPMYDGALFAVPERYGGCGKALVGGAFRQALLDVGVPARLDLELRRAWGGPPEPEVPEGRD